jgi:hypothetical protein
VTDFALIEDLEPAEVERFVGFLPESARSLLAEGPWPEPHCGVCRAIDIEQLRSSGPAATLLDWHDTPFRRNFKTTHWREGKEVYARCLAVYRAAGWQG